MTLFTLFCSCCTGTSQRDNICFAEVCSLKKINGPCDGYYPTWYYDAERKQCGQFVYGGCLGNGNRFETKELCDELCITPETIGTCTIYSSHNSTASFYLFKIYNNDSIMFFHQKGEYCWSGDYIMKSENRLTNLKLTHKSQITEAPPLQEVWDKAMKGTLLSALVNIPFQPKCRYYCNYQLNPIWKKYYLSGIRFIL